MVLAVRSYMKYGYPYIMAHVRIRPCEICGEQPGTEEDSSPITWISPYQFHSTNILSHLSAKLCGPRVWQGVVK